jgi:hypothetical protein
VWVWLFRACGKPPHPTLSPKQAWGRGLQPWGFRGLHHRCKAGIILARGRMPPFAPASEPVRGRGGARERWCGYSGLAGPLTPPSPPSKLGGEGFNPVASVGCITAARLGSSWRVGGCRLLPPLPNLFGGGVERGSAGAAIPGLRAPSPHPLPQASLGERASTLWLPWAASPLQGWDHPGAWADAAFPPLPEPVRGRVPQPCGFRMLHHRCKAGIILARSRMLPFPLSPEPVRGRGSG